LERWGYQMKSGAEPHTALLPRGAALFDRIDYRLIETPEDKDHLYLMRYRAYLHAGLIVPSESRRISDRFDDAPNTWTFGIYVDGELCSSVRIHVLTPEWRMSYTTEVFGDVLHPRLDRGEVFIDPCRFVADPEQHKRFPELQYLSAAGLRRMRSFQCRYRARDGAYRPSAVLSPRLSARDHFNRAAWVSGLAVEEGGLDGVRFPEAPGKGPGTFSHHALQRL
jgi:hypothetical protein